jgi:hypothetical protein
MCSGYDNMMNRIWDNINRGVRILDYSFHVVAQRLTIENSANGRTFDTSTFRAGMMRNKQTWAIP